MKKKVCFIVGTRPEIIKLSRVMAELEKQTEHILVHTGQNYDYELNEIFFKDLKNHWGPNEVGTLWWDLTNTKYIDYEQGELEYRRLNWGKLFPGTQINVYEWVEPWAYLRRHLAKLLHCHICPLPRKNIE